MSRRTLESDILIDVFHVSVRKDMVELPDGSVIEDFYTGTIPDAAMICALTDEGDVLLKSEYRYEIGEDVIEWPAGMFEPGETDPFEVLRIPLAEAVKMVMDGRINANSTAHLIFKEERMGAGNHKLLNDFSG